MKHTNYILLIVFLALLGYQCMIGACKFIEVLAERTVNALVLSIEDSRSLQQSAIDSAKGAGQ